MARQGTKAGAGRASAGTTCRDTGRLLGHSSCHPCRQLLPDGAPFRQPLPDDAPFRQVAFVARACCDSRFPRSPTAPFANPHRCPQPVTASRCCRILFHAGSPAERQLSRTDFRFAPSPRSASLAGTLPFTRGMGAHGLCGRVPDSAGKVYLPDCICPLDCCCSDRRKSVGPSAPIAYATSVSPPDEAVALPGTQILDAG